MMVMLKTVKEKEKEFINIAMETSLKALGMITTKKEKESFSIKKGEIYIQDNSKKENSKDLGIISIRKLANNILVIFILF